MARAAYARNGAVDRLFTIPVHRPTLPRHEAMMAARRKKALTVDDVRALALALPETTEKPSYGTPGFRVKDKLFARMKEDGVSLAVFISFEQREVMLASAPDVFFLTAHYENSPMVLVRLDTVGKALLADILEEAWRIRAPALLRKQGDTETRRHEGGKTKSKRKK